MKKIAVFVAAGVLTAGLAMASSQGEELFEQNCAMCHPDGGNIINPQKPLHKASLNENGIHTADDIIAKMRHPGPGMTPFDAKTLPDNDAKKIADYIMATFR